LKGKSGDKVGQGSKKCEGEVSVNRKEEGGESGFGESGFGETGFGESGFGETGFGESGFGETGFGESGFGESAPNPSYRVD
jgi:PPE-repeat protein